METSEKHPGGRPKIEFDEELWQQIKSMCQIHCTGKEIAAIIGVHYDTLERRVVEKFGMSFADWYKEASAGGKMSLRRLQYESAKKGNTAMLIWMGKQYLGQSDKSDVYQTNNNFNLSYDVNEDINEDPKQRTESNEV